MNSLMFKQNYCMYLQRSASESRFSVVICMTIFTHEDGGIVFHEMRLNLYLTLEQQ
jgi:uncharacterized protein (DUF1015 family)